MIIFPWKLAFFQKWKRRNKKEAKIMKKIKWATSMVKQKKRWSITISWHCMQVLLTDIFKDLAIMCLQQLYYYNSTTTHTNISHYYFVKTLLLAPPYSHKKKTFHTSKNTICMQKRQFLQISQRWWKEKCLNPKKSSTQFVGHRVL